MKHVRDHSGVDHYFFDLGVGFLKGTKNCLIFQFSKHPSFSPFDRGATKWLPAIPICGPLESSQYLRKPVYYTLSLKCISGKTSRQVLSCQLCQEQRGSFYVIEMLSHFEATPLVHSDKRSRVRSYLVGEGQLSSVVMETKVTTKAETRVQSLS